jgi:hypothetical protein
MVTSCERTAIRKGNGITVEKFSFQIPWNKERNQETMLFRLTKGGYIDFTFQMKGRVAFDV